MKNNNKKTSKIAERIFITISIVSLFGIGFYINESINNNTFLSEIEECREIKHYILHQKTKRIHIDSCESEDRMSEKNKKEVDDSIFNLVLDGYVICGNCNAGLKNANSFIDTVKLKNSDIKYYDVGKLPSKEEYISSIEKMGEWYTTHIPTYVAKFQEEPLGNEFENGAYIKEYKIDSKKYNIVTDDEKDSKFINDKNLQISRANEKAINNYIDNKSDINYRPSYFKRNTAYYPCEYLENAVDDYNMAGDDCIRYFFSIINNKKPDFTYHLHYMTGKEWAKINTKIFYTDDNKKITNSLYKLGFDVYDIKEQNIDIDDDNEVDYIINVIDEDFRLEKGDIMLRKGHLHVYMGGGNNPADNFGCGRVYRNYPRNYNFEKQETNDGICYLIKEEGNLDLQYTRIYRYKGVKR